jgi:putative transposase
VDQKRKGKPPRLDRIFAGHNAPLFFVTFNTHTRRPLLASSVVHEAFLEYGRRASEHGIGVGRYVLMPDHVHLFVRFGLAAGLTLGSWVKGLKRHLDAALSAAGKEQLALPGQKLRSFWQPGFHDHLLRSDESYSEKWNYARDNPVSAGLVSAPEEWPYAGEIVCIDRP